MGKRTQVLLVDDSRISRLMLKAIILNQYPDWTVSEAENADAALNLCRDNAFDFITLDMNMPGRDGLTVSPELQEACPDAKIALLTANFQERVKSKAQDQGLTFLPKPITEEKVLNYLAAASKE
jgi:two-component system, chemotaxis family, chemotaxis protein CheY